MFIAPNIDREELWSELPRRSEEEKQRPVILVVLSVSLTVDTKLRLPTFSGWTRFSETSTDDN